MAAAYFLQHAKSGPPVQYQLWYDRILRGKLLSEESSFPQSDNTWTRENMQTTFRVKTVEIRLLMNHPSPSHACSMHTSLVLHREGRGTLRRCWRQGHSHSQLKEGYLIPLGRSSGRFWTNAEFIGDQMSNFL